MSSHSIFNLLDLKKFRQTMHSQPETGFKEFQTQKAIKEFLLKSGVQEKEIKVCAGTGLYIDLRGKASPQGKDITVALRADIDALPMTEENPELEYKSQTNAAHACGHDGHTTSLLGFVQLFLEKQNEIPSNKCVRAFFQPCEEGPLSGAKEMIKDGVLEGVNEVYGYHNWPKETVGYLAVRPGPVMAQVVIIRIDLKGKGGHGSQPQMCIDPVQMAVCFHVKLRILQEKYKNRKCVINIPVLKAGDRFNVIANTCHMEGTLRTLETTIPGELEKDMTVLLEEVKTEFPGSDFQLEFFNQFDVLNNTKEEAEHVERVGKSSKLFDRVGYGCLPVMASEDFGCFTEKVSGAFFFLGSGRVQNDVMLHNCHFDFNDNLIKPASKFFLELVYDRFEIQQ